MQKEITSDISRLSLHDSSFIEVVRHDQNLDLKFDWSKLDNFKEENYDETIIIGKTEMFLTGVHSEQFKVHDASETGKFVLRPLPDNYTTDSEVIGTNSIDDNTKTIVIGRLYKENEVYEWTEWSFKFDTCKVSWNSFVTYTEWKNGKLPND